MASVAHESPNKDRATPRSAEDAWTGYQMPHYLPNAFHMPRALIPSHPCSRCQELIHVILMRPSFAGSSHPAVPSHPRKDQKLILKILMKPYFAGLNLSHTEQHALPHDRRPPLLIPTNPRLHPLHRLPHPRPRQRTQRQNPTIPHTTAPVSYTHLTLPTKRIV